MVKQVLLRRHFITRLPWNLDIHQYTANWNAAIVIRDMHDNNYNNKWQLF